MGVMWVVMAVTVEWGVEGGGFECDMGSMSLTGEYTEGVIPPPLEFVIIEREFLLIVFPVEGGGVCVSKIGVCLRLVGVVCVVCVYFFCCKQGVVLCLWLCLHV